MNIKNLLTNYIEFKEGFISSYDISYIDFIINNIKISSDAYILDCHGLRKDELLYFLKFFDTLKIKTKLTLITGSGNHCNRSKYIDFNSNKLWKSPLKELIINYYRKTNRQKYVYENNSSIVIKFY